jgi:DeoR family fructose operon transcriptional repressor
LNIDRRSTIKQYIEEKGEVHLRELEELLPEVSSMTLRRDLIYLEEKGYVIRTRGGAVSVKHVATAGEDMYSLRAAENMEGKTKIAKKAVEFVETGRSIYIDSGTTMMCLAKELPDENFSILTSGPNIGLEIIKKTKPSVVLTGGAISRNNLSTSGLNSLYLVKNINIDMAFMATSGYSLENGFTSGNFNECELKKLVIEKARKKILLMDITKIDKTMPYTFATLKDIDILICDADLPDDIKKAAQENGVLIY